MTLINIVAGVIYTKGFPLKEKIQLYGMAAVFLVLLYNSPAGLVLYWTLNNVFSLLKNLYYAIKSKRKNTVIGIGLSAFCVCIIYYMLVVHKGDRDIRTLISVLCALLACIPWLVPFIKKVFNKFPHLAYTKKDLVPLFVCSVLTFWALTGLVTPSLLIASSPQEFSFLDKHTTPLFFIGNTALQAFGFFMVWPLCLYALFSLRIKKAFLLLYITVLTSAICNVFLFPGNYGLISVTLEFSNGVGHNGTEIALNLLVMLIPATIFLLLLFKHLKSQLMAVIIVLFCSLLGLSIFNMLKIQDSYREMAEFYRPDEESVHTVEPIFHLSTSGKNVVVIMLDKGQSAFMPYIFEEAPELKDVYSGFVYYPNTVSFNGYTGIGAPPIFGGYESTPVEINKRDAVPLRQKHNEALMMMPRIFLEAGYAVTATDSPYANYTQKPDMRIYDQLPGVNAYITDSVYTDIWMAEHNFILPSTSDILERGIFLYSLLRAVPFAFRSGIYMRGDWCSPISNRSLRLTLNGYSVLDYFKRLTDFSASAENTSLFMVNNTTHEASYLQAPDYIPVISVTNYGNSPYKKDSIYHVNMAAIKRLGEWFDFLKAHNAYDNTRIILVADHGTQINYVSKTSLPFALDNFNPLLMVKDFNATGSLKTDNTFMSNADVPTIALRDLITNPVNPYTGNAITDEAKKGPLYIAISGSVHIEDGQATQFELNPKEDHYVHDNIFDERNWERAER
jgi:hypothetical protein